VEPDVAGAPALADEQPGTDAAVPAATLGSVAKGVSWKVLSVAVGQGSWYASLFVLAILVAPHDFGVVAIGSVIASATLLLLSSGTGGSMIVSRDLTPAAVRRSLVRTSVAGLVATAAFIALAGPIADAFTGGSDATVLRVLGLTIGLSAVSVVPNALLSKQLRFKAIAQIWIAAAVIASAAAIVAAAAGAGVWSLAIRLVVNQAIVTVLSCYAARDLLPRRGQGGGAVARRSGSFAFLLIAASAFFAWTLDNLVVGAFTNPTALGLYTLAFSLAFAPLTQVSWNVGQVLLPAIAAARDEAVIRRQTLKAVRVTALVLLPLAPLAIATAPGLIPAVLGRKWTGMVFPFQVLMIVGVGQSVVNILGEALAGASVASARLRSRIDLVWALCTIGAIVVGVNLDGIRGAALAHLVTFTALALAYALRGGRGIGLSMRALAGALAGVGAAVAAEAAATAAVTLSLHYAAGADWLVSGLAGAAAGALAFAAILGIYARDLIGEGREILAATLRRRRSA